MSRRSETGVVGADTWRRIGADDELRRSSLKEQDTTSSLLTAAAALLSLAMLAVGPMWTLIAVVGDASGRGPLFDRLWTVPLALTLAAALPLALALRREQSSFRFALAGLLAVSLAIELATCPWF